MLKNCVHLAFGYGELAMFSHYIRRGNEMRKHSSLSEIRPSLIMTRYKYIKILNFACFFISTDAVLCQVNERPLDCDREIYRIA